MRSQTVWLTVVLSCGVVWFVDGCSRKGDDDFVGLMNRGKAYLENRNSKDAIRVLTQAVDINPNSAPALRNLGRAYRLARQHPEALDVLNRAAQADGESATTNYLIGLTYLSLSKPADAVPFLEQAVRLDPNDATLRFQLASAYDVVSKPDKAFEQLHETVRLDHLHASAHFKLQTHARRAGDREAFQEHSREFMRLRRLFGDQTRSAEALEQCRHTRPEAAEAPVVALAATESIDVRFVDATASAFASKTDRSASAVDVLSVDHSGRATLIAVGSDGQLGLLTMNSSGVFDRSIVDGGPSNVASVERCVVVNFDDDVPAGKKYDPKIHAIDDVVLGGADCLRLLKGVREGTEERRDGGKEGHRDDGTVGEDALRFAGVRDVTDVAGMGDVSGGAFRFVDYEHDGDLDVVLSQRGGLQLWQNNGGGRFDDVTAKAGLSATGLWVGGVDAAVDIVAVDLNADVAVDLIVARGDRPTIVFENQRAGVFSLMADPPGPWPAADRVLANDLDNDGVVDVVLLTPDEAVVLSQAATKRHHIPLGFSTLTDAALVDFDNDGLLDLVVAGTPSVEARDEGDVAKSGAMLLFRNDGSAGWSDVSTGTGLASIVMRPARKILPVDIDADGDSDLVVVSEDGLLHLLRNDGGSANGQLKIRLTTVKTNSTGLGTHIELRRGRWLATRTVDSRVIEIGLGRRTKLDSLQTVWTNGVVDNQIDVVVSAPHDAASLERSAPPIQLEEKNVATGSCPLFYAWDGSRFRFVTDLLGNSPIGLPLSRDQLLPADPDEIVYLGDASQFPPRDGTYHVVITDEFREIAYIDNVRLMAVDHRADVEIHPTDKLMPPPFPESELWALVASNKLVDAVGGDGINRTDALQTIDGVYAPPGVALPAPYRGMTHPLALTLDFGPLDSAQPLVLALTGWLQYGDGSTNIALSQDRSLTIISPTLSVETSDGTWMDVDATVGMPAGKTKTILVDLAGRLPVGARRLRLTTTFEIRWDRIALFERRDLSSERIHEVEPSTAELSWRGVSELAQRKAGHPWTPDFDTVYQQPPWRTTLEGWCTRYGDVLELVDAWDDKMAVLNCGDALTLTFAVSDLPPAPTGMRRTFFFYSVGWDKDGDYNVIGGDRVGPLPTSDRATPVNDDWRRRYNTRWVDRNRFRYVE